MGSTDLSLTCQQHICPQNPMPNIGANAQLGQGLAHCRLDPKHSFAAHHARRDQEDGDGHRQGQLLRNMRA